MVQLMMFLLERKKVGKVTEAMKQHLSKLCAWDELVMVTVFIMRQVFFGLIFSLWESLEQILIKQLWCYVKLSA